MKKRLETKASQAAEITFCPDALIKAVEDVRDTVQGKGKAALVKTRLRLQKRS